MTPDNSTINIVELSQLSERVVVQSTDFLQRVMKVRYDSAVDLRESAESIREDMIAKLKASRRYQ